MSNDRQSSTEVEPEVTEYVNAGPPTHAVVRVDQAAEILERLKALNRVSNELSKAISPDDLCRQAVLLGRQELGFDRLGIWFLTEGSDSIHGSYGVDEEGDLRDERASEVKISTDSLMGLVLYSDRACVRRSDGVLMDDRSQEVGRGWQCVASLWDGERVIGAITVDTLLSAEPISDDQEELLGLFATSIGHFYSRRSAEAAIKRMNEELERRVAARTAELRISNEELEAFCYSVSHDLRAPLRAIDGFSFALLEDYGQILDDEARGYIDRVRGASRRMDELITSLLMLSRLTRSEVQKRQIDLTALANRVCRQVEETHATRKFSFAIDEGMRLQGDPHLIKAVLDNLVDNAVKFTAGRPVAEIHVGTKSLADGRTAYFVKDNGAGFDNAYYHKLFRPFERLHSPKEYPGSGIGLATVQRIVSKHGGEVWAEGEEGAGATFYFTV